MLYFNDIIKQNQVNESQLFITFIVLFFFFFETRLQNKEFYVVCSLFF